ncbi:Cullin [Artemisia annua]|uniref:Cullin n=1 Tax=Artemisia annua TaxID=35608 RepID=A0A2U1NJ01_ARTAN|nr:Cullin [Artemisia annua]
MLKDIKTSLDTVKGFYEDMKPADGPRLGVHVLSIGSWPSQLTRATTCNLPPEIIRLSENFRTYYLGIHKRRKLTWQTNMGSAAIKATFGTKQYELSVSTYQMCLQSLACAAEEKKNVLRKEPISTDINEDDVFTVNENVFYTQGIGSRKASDGAESRANGVMSYNNLDTEVTKQIQSRIRTTSAIIKQIMTLLTDCCNLQRDTQKMKICFDTQLEKQMTPTTSMVI